jgi:hypothetical protein
MCSSCVATLPPDCAIRIVSPTLVKLVYDVDVTVLILLPSIVKDFNNNVDSATLVEVRGVENETPTLTFVESVKVRETGIEVSDVYCDPSLYL